MFFLKKKAFLGIDIGHYSLKAAVLDSGRNRIIDLIEKQIMPERQYFEDSVEEDKIVTRCKDALDLYLSGKSGYETEFSSSIQGEGAISNYIEFPALDKKKLEMAIKSSTIKYIPYPIDEAEITYIPIPPLKNSEENKAFFFSAINKSFINKERTFMEKCGIKLSKTENFIIPLLKSFSVNQGKFPDEFITIIYVGSRITSVVVIRDGYPYYARDFSVGGSDFTYSFQMASQSSWQEAEDYKINYDFTLKKHSVESALLKWLEQIRKSLAAFKSLNRKLDLSISRIFLTGGSARLMNLDKRLSQYLDIPVVVDSWKNLKPDIHNDKVFAGTFNLAIGLSL